mgnify:CR=1 FL=1
MVGPGGVQLGVWGEYPMDKKPVLGLLRTRSQSHIKKPKPGEEPVWKGQNLWSTISVKLSNGWWYVYTGDLDEEMKKDAARRRLNPEGMCVYGWFLSLKRAQPGHRFIIYLDDIKFSNVLPVPPQGPEKVTRLRQRWRELHAEYRAALPSIKDEKIRQELIINFIELQPYIGE